MIDYMEESLWDWFIAAAVKFVITLVITLVLYMLYGLYRVATAETFSLIKADWVCSREELRNTVTSVVASNGSVVVVPSTTTVCVQYTLKTEE